MNARPEEWGEREPVARALVEQLRRQLTALGASFPQWRFPAQSFPGGSLLERFGMTRLVRPTDVRDAQAREPDRDEFGPGFVRQIGVYTVEYRRAYLAVAKEGSAAIAVLVRNNSPYFGQDRLPEPVLLTTTGLSTAALQAITPKEVGADGPFESWEAFTAAPLRAAQVERLHRLREALAQFTTVEAQFETWLTDRATGVPHLIAFLAHQLTTRRALPFLTRQRPCGDVVYAASVTAALVQDLERWQTTGRCSAALKPLFDPKATEGLRWVMASGPTGDRLA